MLKAVSSNKAPKAIGPYSQAVIAGNLLFTSGQIAMDPQSGEMVEGGIEAQARRVLDNLGAVLAEAGAGFDDVIKTTIFLNDMNDFATVNAIYAEYFKGPVLPARSTVQVAKLPKGALIEIEAIARLRGDLP